MYSFFEYILENIDYWYKFINNFLHNVNLRISNYKLYNIYNKYNK